MQLIMRLNIKAMAIGAFKFAVHLLLYKVARTTGLEPVTSADHRGALNQLSYVLKLNLAGATELESVQIVLETIMLIQLHHAPI